MQVLDTSLKLDHKMQNRIKNLIQKARMHCGLINDHFCLKKQLDLTSSHCLRSSLLSTYASCDHIWSTLL